MTRLAITQAIINLMPDHEKQPVEQVIPRWYYNIRSTGGFRLTELGYETLKRLQIESWEFKLDNPKAILTKKMVLDLDRKLNWPFYIDTRKKKIIFFSSREAMMATLYGDLKNWLDNTG